MGVSHTRGRRERGLGPPEARRGGVGVSRGPSLEGITPLAPWRPGLPRATARPHGHCQCRGLYFPQKLLDKVLQTPWGQKEHPTAKGWGGHRSRGGGTSHHQGGGCEGGGEAQPEGCKGAGVDPGQPPVGLAAGFALRHAQEQHGGHSPTRAPPAPALCSLESLVGFGHPSPSWGGEICCSKDLKRFKSLLLRSRQCSPMPQGDVYGVCGDLVQGGVPPGTPMQGCPSCCWGPHGCCWYWPSVAVKKSSSTLFM